MLLEASVSETSRGAQGADLRDTQLRQAKSRLVAFVELGRENAIDVHVAHRSVVHLVAAQQALLAKSHRRQPGGARSGRPRVLQCSTSRLPGVWFRGRFPCRPGCRQKSGSLRARIWAPGTCNRRNGDERRDPCQENRRRVWRSWRSRDRVGNRNRCHRWIFSS